MQVFCPDVHRSFRLSPKEARAVRRSWFLHSPNCELDGIGLPKSVNRIKSELAIKLREEEAMHRAAVEAKKERSVKELHEAFLKGEKLTILEYLMGRYEVEARVVRNPITQLDTLKIFFGAWQRGNDGNVLDGRKILDVGCGSNEGAESLAIRKKGDYEPWLCRALHLCGARAFGVDIGGNEGEEFAHYKTDLSDEGALRGIFGDSHSSSFDAIVCMNFLGNVSPMLWKSTTPAERQRIKNEVFDDSKRLLKEGGCFLYDYGIYKKEGNNLIFPRE